MTLPPHVRALLGAAGEQSLPFAVWRRPAGAGFEAMIACGPVSRRPVFTEAGTPPFFALSRFLTSEANLCDAIEADVLVRGSEIAYRAGETYGGIPADARQRALAAAAEARDPGAPLPADAGADRPAETREAGYRALVKKAVAAIETGTFRKVVTSRCEARPLAADADLLSLVEALARKLPQAFVCLVRLPGEGAWLVGTPETLLSVRDGRLFTIALAGTQWAKDDLPLADVCWPDKTIEEQALVAAYIRRTLDATGLASFDERGPRTVAAANLVHLRSDFTVELGPGDAAQLSAVLDRLHPTSAVLGMPKAPALAFLKAHEGYDRSYYTGFLGPVGLDGATDLFVNLRTAQIIGHTAYLYVGGGIVAQSKPDVEWQETVEKTKTVGTVLDTQAPAAALSPTG